MLKRHMMAEQKTWKGTKHKKRRKLEYSNHHRQHFPDYIVQNVQRSFDKIFTYSGSWPTLRATDLALTRSAPLWHDERLQEMKTSLNEVKSQLNEYEISEWHSHTSAMNPANLIINMVKKRVFPELCTQAWCKLHEILARFPNLVTSDENGSFRSLHLCEAPGAFITSLNHYLQIGNTMVSAWDWRATTLNPHYEGNVAGAMIADDRFIQNTMSNWLFGHDNSGNIMSASNVQDLIQECCVPAKNIVSDQPPCYTSKQSTVSNHLANIDESFDSKQSNVLPSPEHEPDTSMDFENELQNSLSAEDFNVTNYLGSMHLVTADGSICCANNPSQQEQETAKLHFCELVTSLCCLATGGSLVIKMFTLFEESSISMLYLMNTVFQEVHVVKPASSKPGNSEVYVIGLGFTKLESDVKKNLMTQINESPLDNCIIFENRIPDTFKEQHRQCCQKFYDFQTATIQRNRETHGRPLTEQENSELFSTQRCCAQMYLDRCGLRPLNGYEQRVVSRGHTGKPAADLSYVCKQRQEGSYVSRTGSTRFERLKEFPVFDLIQNGTFPLAEIAIDHALYDSRKDDIENWPLITGRKLPRVNTARFCDLHLLMLYHDFLDEILLLERKENEAESSDDQGSIKSDDVRGKFGKSVNSECLRDIFDQLNNRTKEFSNTEVKGTQTEDKMKEITLVHHGTPGVMSKELLECFTKQQDNICSLKTKDSSNRQCMAIHVFEYCDETLSSLKKTLDRTNLEQARANAEREILFLTEKTTQMQCLQELPRFLNGDHLVLSIPFPVTRFAASTLFILTNVFESIQFFPSHIKTLPLVNVLCLNFQAELFDHYRTLIQKVILDIKSSGNEGRSVIKNKAISLDGLSRDPQSAKPIGQDASHSNTSIPSCQQELNHGSLAEMNFQSNDLLQFVPIKLLYSTSFYSAISRSNDSALQLRINDLKAEFEEYLT